MTEMVVIEPYYYYCCPKKKKKIEERRLAQLERLESLVKYLHVSNLNYLVVDEFVWLIVANIVSIVNCIITVMMIW